MIVTVTLNPAIDKTMEIDDFSLGLVNREKKSRIDAGGKGINVSKVIKILQGESIAIGFLAGNSGDFIEQQLNNFDIKNDFVFINGETRTNLKVVDLKNKIYTDINENGPVVLAKDLLALQNKIERYLKKDYVLVLSGSIPRNLNKNLYFEMIKSAKKKGVKVILDADGELLYEGVKAGPYLVKPNINELERLYGVELNTKDEIIKCAKKIFDYGVEVVVVSLGGDGSIFITKNQTIVVEPVKVDVKSTVGAGDSMVAALAQSIDEKYQFDRVIRLSVASATGAVMVEGTQVPNLEDILKIYDKVKYHQI